MLQCFEVQYGTYEKANEVTNRRSSESITSCEGISVFVCFLFKEKGLFHDFAQGQY